MTTIDNVTTEQIEHLRENAQAAGNASLAYQCDRALGVFDALGTHAHYQAVRVVLPVVQAIRAAEAMEEPESDEDREQRALADIAREDAEHRANLESEPE